MFKSLFQGNVISLTRRGSHLVNRRFCTSTTKPKKKTKSVKKVISKKVIPKSLKSKVPLSPIEELIKCGIQSASKNKFEESAKFFLDALKLDDKNIRVMSLLGELYDRGLNQPKEAVTWLRRCISAGCEDPDAYIRLAHILLRMDFEGYNPAEARECYERAMKITKSVNFNFEIGFVSYEMNDYDRAIACLEIAKEKDSSGERQLNALILLADIYASRANLDPKSLDTAIDYYKEAIIYDPATIEIKLGLSICYIKKKEYVLAEKHLNEIKSFENVDIDVFNTLSELYLLTGRPEEAYNTTQAVLDMNPKHVIGNYLHGKALYEKTLYGRAIKHVKYSIDTELSKVVNTDENNPMTTNENLEIIDDEFALGEPLSDERIIDAYFTLGKSYTQTGDIENAKKMLQRCVEIDPNHVLAHLSLGEIYDQINEPKTAVDHYKIASILDPLLIKASFLAGTAYAEMGQFEQAIIYFQKVLKNYEMAKKENKEIMSSNEREMISRVYNNLSACYQRLSVLDKSKAAEHLSDAKRYFELSRNPN